MNLSLLVLKGTLRFRVALSIATRNTRNYFLSISDEYYDKMDLLPTVVMCGMVPS